MVIIGSNLGFERAFEAWVQQRLLGRSIAQRKKSLLLFVSFGEGESILRQQEQSETCTEMSCTEKM